MTGVVDRFIALVTLVVTSPLLSFAAVGIRRASPGPVCAAPRAAGAGGGPVHHVQSQERCTYVEHVGTDHRRPDAQIFPFGALLHRYKLDELPSVDVLRGRNGFWWPRPEDLSIVREHYDALMSESLHKMLQDRRPGQPAESRRSEEYGVLRRSRRDRAHLPAGAPRQDRARPRLRPAPLGALPGGDPGPDAAGRRSGSGGCSPNRAEWERTEARKILAEAAPVTRSDLRPVVLIGAAAAPDEDHAGRPRHSPGGQRRPVRRADYVWRSATVPRGRLPDAGRHQAEDPRTSSAAS